MKYCNITFPGDLEVHIIQKIRIVEKRAKIRRLIGLGVVSATSFTGIVTMGIYLGNAMSNSGVTEYVSVVASDSGSIGAYWKELALSVAESLPVLGVIALLTAVGVFMWSGARVLLARKQYKTTQWSSI
jgi:hypothetical protein